MQNYALFGNQDCTITGQWFRWLRGIFRGILCGWPVPQRAGGSASCRCWRRKKGPEIQPVFGDDSEQKQRRQMLIALALLLVALILVLVKDRDFWFPPEPAAQSESEPVEEPSPEQKPPQSEAATATTPAAVTRSRRSHARRRPRPSPRRHPLWLRWLPAGPCFLRWKSK